MFNNVVLFNVYLNLNLDDLYNCSLVSKQFNKLFNSNILWNNIITKKYGNKF